MTEKIEIRNQLDIFKKIVLKERPIVCSCNWNILWCGLNEDSLYRFIYLNAFSTVSETIW